MQRTALITGVSGFAGRHLARRLLASGWEVHGTVRTRSAAVAGVTEHKLDLLEVQTLSGLLETCRPDVVYHLAAIVDTVVTPDVMELHRVNVLGTAAVLEAVRRTSSVRRVVVASSSFAYGATPEDQQPVAEDTVLRPQTAYGASKAATEAIALQWWRETGIDVIVTRAFQHTGPGHVGSYALADWARQLASGARRLRVGNLDAIRDYLDVRDVAAAYELLADRGDPGLVFNVGSGVPRSMRSMLDGLVEAFGDGVTVEPDPARMRTVDQPVFFADIGRITSATGWRPTYELHQTFKDIAEWWRTQNRTRTETSPGPSA